MNATIPKHLRHMLHGILPIHLNIFAWIVLFSCTEQTCVLIKDQTEAKHALTWIIDLQV